MWGSIIGAGLGLLGSSGSNKSSTTQQLPPEFRGLATDVAKKAGEIGNMPFTPYAYNQVAGFNPFQFQGFDMIANRAGQSGLPQQAENTLSGFMSGQNSNPFMGQNPYLQQNIDATLGDISKQFSNNVAPTMAASALQSGSFGNTGAASVEQTARNDLAKTMGQVAGGMRMQDYGMQQQLAESGLNRQMNAVGMSPGIYQAGYAPANALLGMGGTMQQQGQNVLDANYNQFQQAQEWPFKILGAMQSPLGTNVGGTTTTRGPAGNPVAGALGGAMLGRQLGGLFNGGGSSFGPVLDNAFKFGWD